MSDKAKKYFVRISIIGLFVICICVHLFKISEIPFGINVDEMGMGYDAWCLNRFGVDRYLNSYPVYLINFGGGQSALYAYLCAFFLEFLELSVFSIRLPGILFYLIAVIYQCRLMKKIKIDDKRMCRVLLTAFFMAILPVYIMLFRIGMDCNLMLAISSVAFFYFLKAIQEERKRDYFFAGIFFGVLLYTYAISYIVLIAFLCITIPYLFYVKKLNMAKLFYMAIPLGILAMPLILVQVVNLLDLNELMAGGVTFTKLFMYRSGDISLENIKLSSIANCIKCIVGYDVLPYNSVSEFGTVYYISIPFILVGFIKGCYHFVYGIRKRIWEVESIFTIWFLLLLVCGCCMEANVNRLNGIYISVLFFLVEGIISAINIIHNAKMRNAIFGVIIMSYTILFILFLQFYFGGKYEEKYEPLDYFNYPLDEALAEQQKLDAGENKTVYIGELLETYIYYLGAVQIDPYEYHSVNKLDESDSESISAWRESFNNYKFYLPETIDFSADYIVGKDNVDYCDKLEELGFLKYETKYYNVYRFEPNNLKSVNGNNMIHWNAGVNEFGELHLSETIQEVDEVPSVVLVGWSYNKEENVVWDSIGMKTNNGYYAAELVEREDVVENIGKNELLRSGFLFVIPMDAFQNCTEATIVCIDSKNEMYYENIIRVY